jgi:hypothetical protein
MASACVKKDSKATRALTSTALTTAQETESVSVVNVCVLTAFPEKNATSRTALTVAPIMVSVSAMGSVNANPATEEKTAQKESASSTVLVTVSAILPADSANVTRASAETLVK